MIKMIIGGSPSTGSSLLARILNRHNQVYCGPETQLFTKPVLYLHWKKYKWRLLKKGIFGLRSPGWHLFNGLEIEDPQLWPTEDLQRAIRQSNTFKQFTEVYFGKYTLASGKAFVIEKSPSNIYCFDAFHKLFPDGKSLQIVRNPLDSIASLIIRGLSPYYAVSHCLSNTAAGMHLEQNERYYWMTYEDLVRYPKTTMTKLCSYLDLDYEHDMIQADGSQELMEGWGMNAAGRIRLQGINRFEQLTEALKEEVLYLAKMLAIRPGFVKLKSEKPITIEVISNQFNYIIPSGFCQFKYASYQRERYKDMLRRTLRGYPTKLWNYPVELIH